MKSFIIIFIYNNFLLFLTIHSESQHEPAVTETKDDLQGLYKQGKHCFIIIQKCVS